MNKILSWLCYIFLKPIVKIIWIKEVRGEKNVPKGNFILAANHQSHWDQVIAPYVVVPRAFTYLGQIDKYEGFEGFLRNLLYKIGGVIPIHRYNEESKKAAIKECVQRLKKGEVLIMYPEGTRSRDGKIGKGKTGIAKIHLESKVPILPIAIKGNFEIMPVGKVFPKFKKIIKINVGKPMFFREEMEKFESLSEEEKKQIYQKITEKVMQEIQNLFNEL